MCKQASYSKYQKSVIRFLTEYLGIDTPFTYERAQNNHLKVLIDGLDKPLYTCSTPSDYKSLANFSADVKRALKASSISIAITDDTEPEQTPNSLTLSNEKLINGCIRSLRGRLEMIKSKEQEKVLESRSLDVIAPYRENEVKSVIELALQNRRNNDYIKSAEKKKFEAKVANHLEFMMPTLAYYADLLESRVSSSKQISTPVTSNKVSSNNTIKLPELGAESVLASAVEQAITTKNSQDKTARNMQHNGTLKCAGAYSQPIAAISPITASTMPDTGENKSSVAELMSMSANNRVALLRNLAKDQALQLINDINQALALNREQDIEAVIALIKEKDVSLDAIIARLDAE